MPDITLDATAGDPPFEQIRSQLAGAIASEALVPGTRLPTVRALAADLDVAVNTVARAYRELEEADLVETRGRHGTYVRGSDVARVRAAEAAHRYVATVTALGVGRDEALDLVRVSLASHGRSPSG